ncbi:uncharacterized protein [Acropora muricata]|uniref:uncharacterized protein n=1 Tax=Acropora muricata TaxID=159855 RepID=UPI0034E4DC58
MIKVALLVTLLAHHAFTAVRFKDSLHFATTDISKRENVTCDLVPSHSNGTVTTPWNNSKQVISISLDNETACTPRPTVIMLGNRVLPSSILLHRCRGGCGHSANIRNCTVTKQEELKIKYRLLDGFKHQVITIYNHTGCECDCMIRSSDCKPTTQYYDPNLCSCRCLKGPTPCDSIYQTWHADRCQCVCNKPTFHPCGANLPWNDKICACGCTNKVMQRCKRKGKLLNKTHCQCECPLPRPVCGPNETFLKKNCTCV